MEVSSARYVPIISGGKVVAVLQAGCDIARKDGVFQPENIAQLERATAKLADQIAEIRPHVFLERIAARAADIAGAESSTVHIYRGTEIIVQAGTGRAEPKFVSGNQPRPDGLGMSARKMGMPQTAAGRALEEKNPALWTAGVRSIAAVALSLGEGEAFGLLFVHRWTDDRAFTPWELEILRVFAGLMEVALTDNFFLEIAKRQADEAWKMFQLQGVLGALGSQAPKSTVLEEVARNALLMFDADNVTLYEFIQDTRTFQCPPVMKGSFWHKEEMQGQVKPTDRLWGFVDAPESQFLEFGEPNRLAPSGKAERDPFVVREAIRASAVIQLRTPDPNEIVGLLFVNFRDARNFSEADKTAIKVVGQSAAIAIRTARLQEAARGDALRRKKQLEAVHRIDEEISRGIQRPEHQRILEMILREATQLCAAERGWIFWGRTGGGFVTAAAIGGRDVKYDQRDGIVGQVALSGKAVLVPDVRTGAYSKFYREIDPATKCQLAAPINQRSERYGPRRH